MGQANAGELSSGYRSLPKAHQYFDWAFAQKVWTQLNTWPALEAEWNKYAAEFEPWLETYKKDRQKAQEALRGYPEAKRQRIQRGYDLQLAWDDWWDNIHTNWYANYFNNLSQDTRWNRQQDAYDFDTLLARYSKPGCSTSAQALSQCGSIPDWRTEKMKAEDTRMMAAAATCVSCGQEAQTRKLSDTERNAMCRPKCQEFWPKRQ